MASHRLNGVTFVRQVNRRLPHAPRVKQGANATAFAGIGEEVVVPAIAPAGAAKPWVCMGQQVFF